MIKQQIMNYPIVIPKKDTLEIYNQIIVPMLKRIKTNIEENLRLGAMRDALLPRLMSGELDVSEVET